MLGGTYAVEIAIAAGENCVADQMPVKAPSTRCRCPRIGNSAK